MRLTKLFTLAGLAYVGYLVYRDVQERMSLHGYQSEDELLNAALNEESGRMQTLTGAGRGASQGIADTSGGERTVTVGRGVTRD